MCLRNGERERESVLYLQKRWYELLHFFILFAYLLLWPKISGTKGKQDRDEGRGGGRGGG